jgi:hypothetical protein
MTGKNCLIIILFIAAKSCQGSSPSDQAHQADDLQFPQCDTTPSSGSSVVSSQETPQAVTSFSSSPSPEKKDPKSTSSISPTPPSSMTSNSSLRRRGKSPALPMSVSSSRDSEEPKAAAATPSSTPPRSQELVGTLRHSQNSSQHKQQTPLSTLQDITKMIRDGSAKVSHQLAFRPTLGDTTNELHSFVRNLSCFQTLTRLIIRGVPMFEDVFDALGKIRTLTFLDWSETSFVGLDLSQQIRNRLGHLPLQSIALEYLPETTPLSLHHFAPFNALNALMRMPEDAEDIYLFPPNPHEGSNKFTSLQHLSISHSYLLKSGLSKLNLKTFNARDTKVVTDESAFLARPTKPQKEYGKLLLGEVPSIKIDIKGDYKDEDSPSQQMIWNQTNNSREVSEHEALSRIKLRAEILRPWFELTLGKSLKHLDLSQNKLDNYQLRFLPQLTELQTLYLSNNPLSQYCLSFIAPLGKLLILDLSDTCISDRTYEVEDSEHYDGYLLTFPKSLQKLRLNRTPIYGDKIQTILELPKLQNLYLKDTKLTQQAIRQIDAFQSARIDQLRSVTRMKRGVLILPLNIVLRDAPSTKPSSLEPPKSHTDSSEK